MLIRKPFYEHLCVCTCAPSLVFSTFTLQDDSGQLELEEFIHGLRGGELNDARYHVVQEAWDHNLRTIKGADTTCIPRAIPLTGLVERFDCSWYPTVRSGAVKEEDVLAAFEAAMVGNAASDV